MNARLPRIHRNAFGGSTAREAPSGTLICPTNNAEIAAGKNRPVRHFPSSKFGQAKIQEEDSQMTWKLAGSTVAVALTLFASAAQAGPLEDQGGGG